MNAEACTLEDAGDDDAGERDEGALLLARYLEGDARAFEALIARFRAPVWGYLVRTGLPNEVCEDLFQETFLRVHQHAASYSMERPFHSWLFTISGNLVRSHLRKKKVRRVMVGWFRAGRRKNDEDETEFDPADKGPSPEQEAHARRELGWLEEALAELPERWRQALVLTQVEGLSQRDAATAMGVKATSIKTWVHRARLALARARAANTGGGGETS